MTENQRNLLNLTSDIVSAFVSRNAARSADLPEIIAAVHLSLKVIAEPKAVVVPAAPVTPSVSIKKSVADDYLICLEDGKKFKSLKRHLKAVYNMTPEDYRAKWGLPLSYPMVAPAYAAARSQLAKDMGLGQNKAVPAPVVVVAPAVAVPDTAPVAAVAERSSKRGKVAAAAIAPEPVAVVVVPVPAKRRGRPQKAA